MIHPTRSEDWKFLGPTVFAVLATGFLVVFLWPAATPGSLKEAFARVRIGMSQEQTVDILETFGNSIDSFFAEDAITEGHSWTSGAGPLKNLPPSHEIAHGVLTISDAEGRDVTIKLGSDGVVSDKQLTPGVWQYRLDKACRTLVRAESDVLTGAWWKDQLHKTKRSLHRRFR